MKRISDKESSLSSIAFTLGMAGFIISLIIIFGIFVISGRDDDPAPIVTFILLLVGIAGILFVFRVKLDGLLMIVISIVGFIFVFKLSLGSSLIHVFALVTIISGLIGSILTKFKVRFGGICLILSAVTGIIVGPSDFTMPALSLSLGGIIDVFRVFLYRS